MEEVGASTQPRLHFSRGTLSEDLGLVFPPGEKIVTLQFLVNKFVQISSVPARQFLQLVGFLISLMDVIPLGRLHIRPNSVVPEGVLASSYSNVGGLYSCCFQTSVVVIEVQPFDRCTSGPPRFHTDFLHRRLPNRMGCLPRRENSVGGVGRLSFRRTHKSSGNEGSSIVIETLPRSDSKTVSVDSHRQCDSGGLSSDSRGTHSFSLYLLCREILLLCHSVQTALTVRHIPGNQNIIADALSRFRVPVNTEWELHPVIFQAITDMGSPPDRSVCHQFELQTGDICFQS